MGIEPSLFDFGDSAWDFDPSGYQYLNDYYGGYGGMSGWEDPTTVGNDQVFFDNTTGQTLTLSQIMSDPVLAQPFQAQFGGGYSLGARNTLGGPQDAIRDLSGGENINWGNILGGGATGLASLLGIAGIAQGLAGGGQTRTVTNQPGQSPLANQAGQAALQGFQGVQNYAFGGPAGDPGSSPGSSSWPGGLAGQLQSMAPAQQQALMQALQGASGAFQSNPFLAQQPDGNPILNQLAQQVQGYGQTQGGMLDASALGAMELNNPSAPWLQGQATGMTHGNLPSLSPALRAQVGATFEPAYQDLNRYLDTSLQQALERSRQQGFAGGNEVFREGTPGTILAPMWAEGMRQQGTLGGQRAQVELALAQSLPQQGGNLANQLFMQQLERAKAMQAATQGYTAPSAVALQGSLGLSNLNQNMIQSLGNFGQQGMGNQLDFLRAMSAPLQGLSGLSGTAQAGAGMRTTQNTPFSLMSAFAPTASLLGGIGGALGGYNATQMQRPSLSGWGGGMY